MDDVRHSSTEDSDNCSDPHMETLENAAQSEFYKTIVESTSAAQFIIDENQFIYVNPAFETLTGYGAREISSLSACDFFPCDLAAFAGDMLVGSTEGAHKKFETKIMTKSGEEKWGTLTATRIKHAQRPALLGTFVDLTEHKQREEALKRSEMRYRAVLEFAPDMVIIYGLDGTIIDANPVALKLWGVSREEAIGLNGPKMFWAEEDRARFPEIVEETLKQGELCAEIKGVHADGRFWFAESNAKVADLGKEKFVVVIVRDVTERKQLEEQLRSALREKDMLLREIHHRVKNNMQIISSLLRLQSRGARDSATRALFRESRNRILSMAMIHEKLYQSEGLHRIDLNDYVRDLATEVLSSFGERSGTIALQLDVQDISFGLDAAIPCGLIIIELLSNSLKYAFTGVRGGKILIDLHSEDRGFFRLTVSDNGVGLPEDININNLKSLGLRLVSDLARYQLEGEMGISGKNGTTAYVRFKEREKNRG
jgi:PAS domain S-box-containing protein